VFTSQLLLLLIAPHMEEDGQAELTCIIVYLIGLQVAQLRADRGSTSLYGLNRRDIDVLLKEWCLSHRDMLGSSRPDDAQLEAVGKFMMAIGDKLDEPDGKSKVLV